MFDLRGYSLSDFFLYSPETYYRLLEIYNLDLWPMQIAAVVLGAVLIGLASSPGPGRGRIIAAGLAASWLSVAYAFHLERYATIHFAAWIFGAFFIVQAALLLWVGVVRNQMQLNLGGEFAGRTGLGFAAFAVFFQPLIERLAGRTWSEVDVFALMPDPTVIATFGFLLMMVGRIEWKLLIIPFLWSAISAAAAWPMGAYENLVTPVGGALTFAITGWKSIRAV